MAIKPLKTIKFPELPDTYTIPQVDATPTQGSSNAVSSGGVYEALHLQIVEHQISPTWIAGGLINKETGEFTESSDINWTYTQLCEIPRSSKIRLSVYASGKAAGVAFYDNTETFISGTSVTSKTNTDLKEYDVPSNAVFARFTNVIGSNYHPDTPLIILLSDKTDAIFDEIIAKIPQIDAAPTQNSANAVRSGAVWDITNNINDANILLNTLDGKIKNVPFGRSGTVNGVAVEYAEGKVRINGTLSNTLVLEADADAALIGEEREIPARNEATSGLFADNANARKVHVDAGRYRLVFNMLSGTVTKGGVTYTSNADFGSANVVTAFILKPDASASGYTLIKSNVTTEVDLEAGEIGIQILYCYNGCSFENAVFELYLEKVVEEELPDTTLTEEGKPADAKVVGDVIDELRNGEYVLRSGTLLTGFYPLQDGTIGDSSSARMAVFPVKENSTYYVTWLDGTNQYRTAFGDTAPGDIALGTPIYNYVDNRQTPHERYPRKNTNHKYLYIYIGSTAAAIVHSVKVSTAIPFLDSSLTIDGAAANSKTVGDAINNIIETLDGLQTQIPQIDSTLTNIGQAADAKMVGDVIDELKNGEYVLRSGTLLVGFYPLANGTIGTNNSARMVVFPIKEDKTYYVTWLEGTDHYRTAFGDTPAAEVALGTPIYDYVDNKQTSHVRYPVKNSTYKFLYVYIGTSSSATLDAVEVSSDIFSFKNCLASDGDQW